MHMRSSKSHKNYVRHLSEYFIGKTEKYIVVLYLYTDQCWINQPGAKLCT